MLELLIGCQCFYGSSAGGKNLLKVIPTISFLCVIIITVQRWTLLLLLNLEFSRLYLYRYRCCPWCEQVFCVFYVYISNLCRFVMHMVCISYSYKQHVNSNTRHKSLGSMLIKMYDIQTANVDIHGYMGDSLVGFSTETADTMHC